MKNPITTITHVIYAAIIAFTIIIGSSLALQCNNAPSAFMQLPDVGYSAEYKLHDSTGNRTYVRVERISQDQIWIHSALMGLDTPMEIEQKWSASFTTQPISLGYNGAHFYTNLFEKFCSSRIEVNYQQRTLDVYVYIDTNHNHLTVPRHYHLVQ